MSLRYRWATTPRFVELRTALAELRSPVELRPARRLPLDRGAVIRLVRAGAPLVHSDGRAPTDSVTRRRTDTLRCFRGDARRLCNVHRAFPAVARWLSRTDAPRSASRAAEKRTQPTPKRAICCVRQLPATMRIECTPRKRTSPRIKIVTREASPRIGPVLWIRPGLSARAVCAGGRARALRSEYPPRTLGRRRSLRARHFTGGCA